MIFLSRGINLLKQIAKCWVLRKADVSWWRRPDALQRNTLRGGRGREMGFRLGTAPPRLGSSLPRPLLPA